VCLDRLVNILSRLTMTPLCTMTPLDTAQHSGRVFTTMDGLGRWQGPYQGGVSRAGHVAVHKVGAVAYSEGEWLWQRAAGHHCAGVINAGRDAQDRLGVGPAR
jgi:hypothetical protein